jgi:hypothetical protein
MVSSFTLLIPVTKVIGKVIRFYGRLLYVYLIVLCELRFVKINPSAVKVTMHVGSEAPTAVILSSQVFCCVTLCRWVSSCRVFKGL